MTEPDCSPTADEIEDFDEDDFEGLVVADPEPQAICAYMFSNPPYSFRQIPLIISFGLASDAEKAKVIPSSDTNWAGFGKNFRHHPCYELRSNGALTGLASLSITATCFNKSKSMYITAQLNAIYLRRRLRGRGICRAFCEQIAEGAYRQILTLILGCPPDKRRSIDITVSAELHSEGGQAAITILADDLCPRLMDLNDLLQTPVEVEAITNDW